jgi:hypothetical protein
VVALDSSATVLSATVLPGRLQQCDKLHAMKDAIEMDVDSDSSHFRADGRHMHSIRCAWTPDMRQQHLCNRNDLVICTERRVVD